MYFYITFSTLKCVVDFWLGQKKNCFTFLINNRDSPNRELIFLSVTLMLLTLSFPNDSRKAIWICRWIVDTFDSYCFDSLLRPSYLFDLLQILVVSMVHQCISTVSTKYLSNFNTIPLTFIVNVINVC